jgi:ketosteroid isomerase-like protein
MTSNAARAATLVRALSASIEGDSAVIGELYTDDVTAWAPALSAASAAELAVEFERRDTAFQTSNWTSPRLTSAATTRASSGRST